MRRRAMTAAERQRAYRSRKKQEEASSFRHKDEVLELLESLPRVRPSFDGPYTFEDRARDFIAVFSGTDSGRRVLSQIHQICDPAVRREDADQPGLLAFDSGKRRVMQEIMLCFVVKERLAIEKTETVNA